MVKRSKTKKRSYKRKRRYKKKSSLKLRGKNNVFYSSVFPGRPYTKKKSNINQNNRNVLGYVITPETEDIKRRLQQFGPDNLNVEKEFIRILNLPKGEQENEILRLTTNPNYENNFKNENNIFKMTKAMKKLTLKKKRY